MSKISFIPVKLFEKYSHFNFVSNFSERPLVHPINIYDEDDFRSRFRMSKKPFKKLFSILEDHLIAEKEAMEFLESLNY